MGGKKKRGRSNRGSPKSDHGRFWSIVEGGYVMSPFGSEQGRVRSILGPKAPHGYLPLAADVGRRGEQALPGSLLVFPGSDGRGGGNEKDTTRGRGGGKEGD